jgi:putative ubiquitin-RnfH superfamily antitoxin RatB of RatAB toxin-antitoxin module
MVECQTARVEVIFGLPDRQELKTVHVHRGAKCNDAIRESGISEDFPDYDLANCPIAIWGSPVGRDHAVKDGDRVEILRPLAIDPRDARRQRALAG